MKRKRIGPLTRFLYRYDDNVDKLLNLIMDRYEPSDLEYTDKWTITLRFGDKITAELWNSGRYYAWLSSGAITVNGKVFIEWSEARPSRKTMNRLLDITNSLLDKKITSIEHV